MLQVCGDHGRFRTVEERPFKDRVLGAPHDGRCSGGRLSNRTQPSWQATGKTLGLYGTVFHK